MNTKLKRNSTQHGMTLLEVLIALAVLSIGLAGMAAMHLRTLQYTQSAYYTSLASAIALDVEERLWIALAETDCDDLDDDDPAVTGLVADVLADWGDASAYGLNVTVSDGYAPSGTKELDVAVTWTESRFASVYNDGANQEQVEYDIRFMCAPT